MEIALEVAHFSKRANNIILGNFAHMTVLNVENFLGSKKCEFFCMGFHFTTKNILVDNSTHKHLTQKLKKFTINPNIHAWLELRLELRLDMFGKS